MKPLFVDKYVDKYGSTVTLKVVNQSFSKYGDASETSSDASVIAVVNVMDQGSELVKQGIMHEGDKVFYFKSTQGDLDRENIIVHRDKQYKIDNVLDHQLADEDYVLEVRTKKI
jgi:hypothetical protein